MNSEEETDTKGRLQVTATPLGRLPLLHLRVGLVLITLCLAILPLTGGQARGIIWLPTVPATQSGAAHLHPVMVTYRNHAYTLSVVETSQTTSRVEFATNQTGTWKTSILSTQGPAAGAYSTEFVALAIDPSVNRIYAAWIYRKNAQTDVLGVWTRSASGQWSAGPTAVATAGTLGGQPTMAAANGKVYVAFVAAPGDVKGTCDDHVSRATDVVVATYGGTSWSLQNVTSCVTNPEAQSFSDPKIAVDESGHAYLVSRAGSQVAGLWYLDNAAGSWSSPVQITHHISISDFAGSPAARGLYGLAASHGTAYVAYSQEATPNGDNVFLITHAPGGPWSAPHPVSPPDPQGCVKYGVGVVARAGRVGVSYIRGFGGTCHVVGVNNDYNVPHLFTGTPGQLAPVDLGLPQNRSCGDTAVSSDGDLFRIAVSCGVGIEKGAGDLFYKREFLDVVGPAAHLTVQPLSATTFKLSWTARDPTPGSGVAYFELQVRQDAGPWRTLPAATHTHGLVYRGSAGHRYAFRLRAIDRVNNWGAWVTRAAP